MSKLLSKTVHNTEYHLIQNLKYYDSRSKNGEEIFLDRGKGGKQDRFLIFKFQHRVITLSADRFPPTYLASPLAEPASFKPFPSVNSA